MITFWIGRRPKVWLNDAQSASDLFDKRAATFSSRPRMVVFGELAFGQSSLVTMYYGDRFRVHRKLTHMGIGMQQVLGYQHLQSDENKVVLYDFAHRLRQLRSTSRAICCECGYLSLDLGAESQL